VKAGRKTSEAARSAPTMKSARPSWASAIRAATTSRTIRRLPNVRIATLCDPDEGLFAERVKLVAGGNPKTEVDLRRVLEDKNIDCVCITMPNYWHALATIWACQAGKDVYVEKPATSRVAEGRKMIAAGKKYDRVVQNGTHMRAHSGRQEAIKLLRDGLLGDLYMARGVHL